jgi:hypothetical protein
VTLEVSHRIDDEGRLRLGIVGHGDDWLGPGTPVGADGDGWVREVDRSAAGRLGLRVGTEPARSGVARPGGFTDLLLGWRFAPTQRAADGLPDDTRALGFQVAEFAFPTRSDASMATWPLLPHRPSALGLLLLVAPDGTTLLVAPAAPHQHPLTIAVGDGTVGLGLHGDLDDLAEGFVASVSVLAASTVGEAIDAWGAPSRFGVERPGRYADALGARLSYWTDNGASYWYRTEPGHTVTSGIAATVADLVDRGVPIGSVQIDSWWYPHEALRPFDTEEWVVPPTGMLEWEARPDILPDGLAPLREAVGGLPLVAHCRHVSAQSPYAERFPAWVDGPYAHPSTAELYEHLLDRCVDQGIATFEHDWLVECFTGIRQLRAEPSRAAAWQRGIDAAAAERGLTLQWCMATLADMVEAASLPRVTSVRTSGDHGYLAGPGFLWAWFLVVNRLARPLGLHPFKDVFLAGSDLAPVDALLSLLSTGPVGVGDRLGQADPAVLRPCHRADGLLVKPDVPVAATDDAFRSWPFGRPRPLVADCWSDHAAGRWRYVVALNPDDRGATATPIDVEVPRRDGTALWDWRARTFVDAMAAPQLAPHDWRLWVEVPVVDGVAVVGDPDLYAPAGDERLAGVEPVDGGLDVTVLGAGEHVELACWSSERGAFTTSVDVPAAGSIAVAVRR